jgi:ABC-type multidrug transport system fused ATPase/permease subunit
MKIQKNEHALDRFIRVLIGEVLLLAAFFWAGGILAIVLYFLGAVMLITALTGFCMLYKPFGINTLKKSRKKTKKVFVYLFLVLFLFIAIVGSYASNFFSKKLFLNDFNVMNNYYKQTLFYTGQDKRQISIENYNKLVIEYNTFYSKYSGYHPYALKRDGKLNQDLATILQKITRLKEKVNSGDLKQAHKDFEEIRPVLQDILKRNNFSLFAVYLVDFHDSMEKVIDASDKKDAAGVIAAYNDADKKLIAVEQEANDDEIKTIRTKLEELRTLAKSGKIEALAKKAAELKSSFVKVYLKRG